MQRRFKDAVAENLTDETITSRESSERLSSQLDASIASLTRQRGPAGRVKVGRGQQVQLAAAFRAPVAPYLLGIGRLNLDLPIRIPTKSPQLRAPQRRCPQKTHGQNGIIRLSAARLLTWSRLP